VKHPSLCLVCFLLLLVIYIVLWLWYFGILVPFKALVIWIFACGIGLKLWLPYLIVGIILVFWYVLCLVLLLGCFGTLVPNDTSDVRLPPTPFHSYWLGCLICYAMLSWFCGLN
jgi:hypothetical protein